MQEIRDSVKILVLGAGSRLKEAIVRQMQRMDFEVISRTAEEQICRLRDSAALDSSGGSGAVRPSGEDYIIIVPDFVQDGSGKWQEMLDLAEMLELICSVKPQAVLLISDTRVYGKVYGKPHDLKEEETGYVCHTDPGDTAAQCMRTLEHLCSRLARENGFPVRIVRADWNCILGDRTAGKKNGCGTSEESAGEEDRKAGILPVNLAEDMIRVLKKGIPGEAYNLPGSYECGEERHSPLSPIPIILDTGKAGRL